MDGGDMIEVEIYKEEEEERRKGGVETEALKRDKHIRGRRKRVNSVTIYTNLSSLGEPVEGEIPP